MRIRSRVEKLERRIAGHDGEPADCSDETCAMRETARAIEEAYGRPPGQSVVERHSPLACAQLGASLETMAVAGFIEGYRGIAESARPSTAIMES